MNVLQIVKQRQPRGAEIFAYELSEELERRGHRTSIAYLYDCSDAGRPPLRQQDTALGGEAEVVLERFPGFQPGLLSRLRGWARTFDPDIVQVNGSRTVKYGSLLRRGAPDARWALVYRSIGTSSDWLKGRLRAALYWGIVLSQVDGIAAVARSSAADFRRRLAAGKPCVEIPRGISVGALQVGEGALDVRRRLGAPPGRGVVLYVGSLSREKRVDRLLRVAGAIAAKGLDLEVWVAGDGPLRGELEQQARAGSVPVKFLGARDDVGALMRAADILLLTSDSEGTPGVVLEAGAVGLPVVATEVGGLRECVVDGETGYLAPVEDEGRLIELTASLLRDEKTRARLGSLARAWVRERFSIEVIAERYLELYGSVLARRGKAARHAPS